MFGGNDNQDHCISELVHIAFGSIARNTDTSTANLLYLFFKPQVRIQIPRKAAGVYHPTIGLWMHLISPDAIFSMETIELADPASGAIL